MCLFDLLLLKSSFSQLLPAQASSSSQTLKASSLQHQFEIDQLVEAKFSRTGLFYKAQILSLLDDGKYEIEWQDKEQQDRIKTADELREVPFDRMQTTSPAGSTWGDDEDFAGGDDETSEDDDAPKEKRV